MYRIAVDPYNNWEYEDSFSGIYYYLNDNKTGEIKYFKLKDNQKMKIEINKFTKTITLLEAITINDLFALGDIIPNLRTWNIKGEIGEVKTKLDEVKKQDPFDKEGWHKNGYIKKIDPNKYPLIGDMLPKRDPLLQRELEKYLNTIFDPETAKTEM